MNFLRLRTLICKHSTIVLRYIWQRRNILGWGLDSSPTPTSFILHQLTVGVLVSVQIIRLSAVLAQLCAHLLLVLFGYRAPRIRSLVKESRNRSTLSMFSYRTWCLELGNVQWLSTRLWRQLLYIFEFLGCRLNLFLLLASSLSFLQFLSC